MLLEIVESIQAICSPAFPEVAPLGSALCSGATKEETISLLILWRLSHEMTSMTTPEITHGALTTNTRVVCTTVRANRRLTTSLRHTPLWIGMFNPRTLPIVLTLVLRYRCPSR